jgi:hypothetical protein
LIFWKIVSSGRGDETIQPPDETISRLWRRRPETPVGYQLNNENGGQRRPKSGDSQMRTFSFILAFAFILAGPSLAGSSDGDLPGIGTFAYNGSPIATTAPQAIVVAAR